MRLFMSNEDEVLQTAPAPESEIRCPSCKSVVRCDLRSKGGLVCIGCGIKLPFLLTRKAHAKKRTP